MSKPQRFATTIAVVAVVVSVAAALLSAAVSLQTAQATAFQTAQMRCLDALLSSSRSADQERSKYFTLAPAATVPPPTWTDLTAGSRSVLATCFSQDLIPPDSGFGKMFSFAADPLSYGWSLSGITGRGTPTMSLTAFLLTIWLDYMRQAIGYVAALSAPSIWPWVNPRVKPDYLPALNR